MPNSSANYEKLFDMSFDMLCITTIEGYFSKVNASFSRVLGFSNEQLLNTPFNSFIHPDDVKTTEDELTQIKKGKVLLAFENRYRNVQGDYLTFSWTATVDQSVGLIYATARDISESKNIKSKLNQIEEALHQKSIIALTDAKGVILEVNNNFCSISGYSESELIGQTHQLVNSGFHPTTFFKNLWRTISSGQVWYGVIKNRNKNGNFYFVESIITPIFDRDHKIIQYLSIRYDITHTVANEELLSKTLGVLNETNSIAKVGGWELDIKTDELTWTDETFNILEVEKQNNQKPILPEGLKLFIPEHQLIIENAVNRAIEYGESYALELKGLTAKGNVRWIFTNGKANYINGEIVSLSGTIQDIHERKVAEEKYAQERQKSIHNAKLASLGELAASVAHEINNPLSIIATYTEVLRYLPYQKEKADQKLEVISKSVDRITHIVKSLKKFSRTDDDNSKQAINLNSIVEEAVMLTEPRLSRASVQIKYDVDAEHLIFANEIEIEQVIVNLINNAIDAVKPLEDKWIDISINKDDQNIILMVTDSGKGIHQKFHSKIFEPFYTSKKIGEGTGLGLSIIKGILKDHNSNIHLDSEHEHTRFIINMPKHKE